MRLLRGSSGNFVRVGAALQLDVGVAVLVPGDALPAAGQLEGVEEARLPQEADLLAVRQGVEIPQQDGRAAAGYALDEGQHPARLLQAPLDAGFRLRHLLPPGLLVQLAGPQPGLQLGQVGVGGEGRGVPVRAEQADLRPRHADACGHHLGGVLEMGGEEVADRTARKLLASRPSQAQTRAGQQHVPFAQVARDAHRPGAQAPEADVPDPVVSQRLGQAAAVAGELVGLVEGQHVGGQLPQPDQQRLGALLDEPLSPRTPPS